MQFKPLGNTGIQTSIIGLGAEHIDNKPYSLILEVIDAAIENGINIIDLFMPGETVRRQIGQALAGRRDKMLIQGAIGSVDLQHQYDTSRDLNICKRYFEDLLRFLNTDYIDFGMLFFLDSQAEVDACINNGLVDYTRQLKQEGKLRAIGASAHNPKTAKRLVEEGLIDMLMFSINPAFDLMPGYGEHLELIMENPYASSMTQIDEERADLYRLCQSRGVGITAMKALGSGKLLFPEHTPFGKPLTIAQCIHYALTRPAVASVLVGCTSRSEVEQAVSYLHASPAERDYSEAICSFKTDARGVFKGSCVYCNHCLPCPTGIDIAALNKYLDIAELNPQNIPPSIAQHYRALSAHGSDCIACGSCEKKCPFSVPVIAKMQTAANLFGK